MSSSAAQPSIISIPTVSFPKKGKQRKFPAQLPAGEAIMLPVLSRPPGIMSSVSQPSAINIPPVQFTKKGKARKFPGQLPAGEPIMLPVLSRPPGIMSSVPQPSPINIPPVPFVKKGKAKKNPGQLPPGGAIILPVLSRPPAIVPSTPQPSAINIPPVPFTKKGKKRKFPGQLPPGEIIVPVLGKPPGIKSRQRSKKKKVVKVELFEPNGSFDSNGKGNKNKKRKSDEQYMPRSSFRLYLRRQNKAQEQKKRTEKFIRTVELIKRPIELRDPATKILFMASLDLYPKSESGGGPIVIIKQSSSNYDHMVNNFSESSETSEQDMPIIEVLSDQDDATTYYSSSTSSTESFFLPEMCMEMETQKIVSSTPIPKARKKAVSKRKDNCKRTRATSIANRKPLTQRQHNSISANKTPVLDYSDQVLDLKVHPKPNIKSIDESFKREVTEPNFNPCVQPQVPEKKPENESDKFGDLDSIKRMLAKLHTYIAPVDDEEIQLITIE